MSVPDEVDRLKAELARLEGELAVARAPAPVGSERTGRWRPAVVAVLLVLLALVAPLAVVAVWARDEISDTDRYVETVTPLASDIHVQRAIADRVTTEVFDRLDVKAVTDDAVAALRSRGLPPRAATSLSALAGPLANGVQGFVHDQVLRLVQTDQFEQAWVEANRAAHDQMVAVLTGRTGDTVEVQGSSVNINLAALINAVKQRLTDRGLALASKIPTVNAQFTIFRSADITKAQNGFRVLGALAHALPWLALLLLAAAVGVARSRRRALVAGGLVAAASMLLLGAALNAFRVVYLDAIPADVLPQAAAGAVYDTLVHFIRLNLRAVLVLFLAVAAIAWLTGPASAPVAVRRGTARLVDGVRHGSDRAGLRTGRLGTALYGVRTPLRVAVLGLALVVYVMAAHPTGAFTLTLLLVVGVVLLVVEVLARPPAAVPEQLPH